MSRAGRHYLSHARGSLIRICAAAALGAGWVQAQVADPAPAPDAELVRYEAAFFSRYHPNTALDMVRQLPGFQLDDGEANRGFASSAGNILINGRRPSAKQDLPSATLARIPAGQVANIELIRGQAAGIDMQGRSVMANVRLRADIPASVRWTVWMQHNNAAPFKQGGNVSLSDRWGGIDYNAGIDLERDTSGWYGTEYLYDEDGKLLESGPDISTEKGFRINSVSFNASSWLGDNRVRLNSRLTTNKSDYHRPTASIPVSPADPVREIIIHTRRNNLSYELGTDIERAFHPGLDGRAILLFINDDQDAESSRRDLHSARGETLYRLADTYTSQEELIGRLELDWSGFANHVFQLNLERAYNVLDRRLAQTDDRGEGPVPVDVPGANSKVVEDRWDLLIEDNWSLGDFELNLGLGAEASTLTQTGDAALERDFRFFKPHLAGRYASAPGVQTRLRLAREVTQLDLTDFVSATVFEDDDIALGNPNLRPETTWITELAHERRFGRVSVVKLTVFHHWIRDVLDLLPITPSFEAPGNIGDGRRWGLTLEGTLPLERLGLADARLDLQATWQDSVVTDPVTGAGRRLSGEGGQGGYRTLGIRNKNIEYHLRLNFRQDFERERFAWGWTVADRGDRPLYKVNELDMHNDGVAVDAFIETTRWFDLKTRLLIENALDFTRSRERFLYSGLRDLSPVENTLVSHRYTGRRFTLSLNGTF